MSTLQSELTYDEFEAEALPFLNDLFRTAVRLVRDRSEAEDLVQEVYLQAWKSYHKYEAGTNCRAWLYKILFNKLDHLRRRQATRRRLVDEGDDFLAMVVAHEPPPSLVIRDAEVLGALDHLATVYREVVLLADVEELSYKEIAAIIEIPIGTVMSRLSRGRAQLREMLAGLANVYGIQFRCTRASRPGSCFNKVSAAPAEDGGVCLN
jgi:RNA polymerase sigma-70 factor, ECF subfamily